MSNDNPATPDTQLPAAPAPVAISKREVREVAAFNPDDPVALYMNTALFEQIQRIAKLMSGASLVPAHLRGADKVSDCFLVVGQAFRWRMDPFAVAQHTFVLSGKLGYEGKLIAAVVNTSGRLASNLNYAYSGKGQDRRVVVTGTLRGEVEVRSVEGSVADWKTQNPKWAEIPDQMLSYRGAREWARRHMPEAVLGVQSEDEVIDIGDAPTIPAATVVSAPYSTAQATEALKEATKAKAFALAKAEAEEAVKGPEPVSSVAKTVAEAVGAPAPHEPLQEPKPAPKKKAEDPTQSPLFKRAQARARGENPDSDPAEEGR